jgi:hypothetical protein
LRLSKVNVGFVSATELSTLNGQTLTEGEVAIVKRARLAGYVNHEIAAYFGVNQGRIAEINTGEVGGHVKPAPGLPERFPPPVRRTRNLSSSSVSRQPDLFGRLG